MILFSCVLFMSFLISLCQLLFFDRIYYIVTINVLVKTGTYFRFAVFYLNIQKVKFILFRLFAISKYIIYTTACSPLDFSPNARPLIKMLEEKGKRKVQGMPQSQTAARSRHQEEEETDKTKQAQIEQTYKQSKIKSLFPKRDNRNAKRTEKHKNKIIQGKT